MMQQQIPAGTPKQNLRASQILCTALMVGCLLFAVIITIVNIFQGPVMSDSGQYADMFLYASFGIAGVCFLGAANLYNKKQKGLKNLTGSLEDKLNQYRELLIIYMALCE